MKKVLSVIVILVALTLVVTGCKTQEDNVEPIDKISYTAARKIKVHFFYGDGCQYCAKAEVFFNKIEKEYSDCYELVSYETRNNEENRNLLLAVSNELGVDEKSLGSVPLIVMGEDFEIGYATSMDNDIIKKITNNCSNDEYTDLVEQVIKNQ